MAGGYRIRIKSEAPAQGAPVGEISYPLLLTLEPEFAGEAEWYRVHIGRSLAEARLTAHRCHAADGQTEQGWTAHARLRAIAQLRHAHQLAHGGGIPVVFMTPEAETPALEGYIDCADLDAELKQLEAHLGVRTRSLDPPIYLQAFWGPRQFGMLDAMIARLEQFDIVPSALLDKARRLDAPANWAVIAPAGLPEREQVLAALEPLIQHRGGRVFELSDGRDPQVVDKFMVQLANMPVEERPYYLLLLGDLDQLSIEFQYFLQSFGAAGRLACPDPQGYHDYARKVLRYEAALDDSPPPAPTYIATDYDDVNARNYQELVRPLAAETGLPAAGAVLACGRAYKARVLDLLGRTPARSPLLLFAHGFEHLTPRGQPLEAIQEDMRQYQGALILDDFESTRPLGCEDGLLCPADVASGPVAPGGIAILHACYSAGTISRDTMPEWIHLRMPERITPPKPFVSRLAQALLANPEGPLAVYGHVNRSHQANYYNPDQDDASFPYRHYFHMLQALSQGLPIGLGRESCRRMTIHYMAQAMTLSHQIEWLLTGHSHGGVGIGWPKKGVGAYERSFLQYSFGTCNFRNYVILGDPMARIGQPLPEK